MPGRGGDEARGMRRTLFVLLVELVLLSLVAASSAVAAAPIAVAPEIEVRNEDWVPLPGEEMKRAAGDAAFDRLTDAGRLRLEPGATDGRLAVVIALVGPAETAGVTMTLDAGGRPTLVSNATISVRGLDHAGIHRAFQHVGSEAADRLVAKLDLFEASPAAPGRPGARPTLGDPERRARFDRAQEAKRAERYAESHAAFEGVVDSGPKGGDTLAEMAADELRYGLPVYEARQALNALGQVGGRGGRAGETAARLERAEHLYRQIRAENADDATRLTEADRAIDEIQIVRKALANALRAQAMNRVSVARMMLTQHVMMEGVCPDLETTRDLLPADDGLSRLSLEDAGASSGSPGARSYRFDLSAGGEPVILDCDRNGVRVR